MKVQRRSCDRFGTTLLGSLPNICFEIQYIRPPPSCSSQLLEHREDDGLNSGRYIVFFSNEICKCEQHVYLYIMKPAYYHIVLNLKVIIVNS